jgi:hypothetical protein
MSIQQHFQYQSQLTLMAFVVVMLMWSSIKDITVFNTTIVPGLNGYLRFLMPGIRKFVRMALIAQGMIVVFAGLGAAAIGTMFKSSPMKSLVPVCLGLVCLIDLNPTSYRYVHRDVESLSIINSRIRENPGAVLLLLDTISPDYVQAPLVGPLENLLPISIDGPERLTQHLTDIGVKYVLAPVDEDNNPYFFLSRQDIGRTKFTLPGTLLPPVSQVTAFQFSNVAGSQEFKVQLLSVPSKRFQGKSTSTYPSLGQVYFDPPLRVDDSFLSRTKTEVNWSISSRTQFRVEALNAVPSQPLDNNTFIVTLKFLVPSGKLTTDSFFMTIGNKKFDIQQISENEYFARAVLSPRDTGEIHFLNPCRVLIQQGHLAGQDVCFGITDFAVSGP